MQKGPSEPAADERYPRLRLMYFQRLDAMQRLRVLDNLGLIPPGATSVPNLTVERMLLERMMNDSAKVDSLEKAIQEQLETGGRS